VKFVIRPSAREDILNQFLYLIDQGVPHAAERFIDAVDKTIMNLTRQPNIGTPKKLGNPRLKGLRKWPVEGFEVVGIYYLVADDVLRVIRVLHGKRDIARVLGSNPV
jgi:toxin ParE1/3/4